MVKKLYVCSIDTYSKNAYKLQTTIDYYLKFLRFHVHKDLF